MTLHIYDSTQEGTNPGTTKLSILSSIWSLLPLHLQEHISKFHTYRLSSAMVLKRYTHIEV
jgi:hypothetical protein